MTLGEKIRRLRKQQGWTSENLAENMVVPRHTVVKWELNQQQPEPEKLKQLSLLFGIPVAHLTDENFIDHPAWGGEEGADEPEEEHAASPRHFWQRWKKQK